MFKQTVASICKDFTKKLEDIKIGKDKELEALDKQSTVLTNQLRAIDSKADAALDEQASATVAIANIEKLFGVKV